MRTWKEHLSLAGLVAVATVGILLVTSPTPEAQRANVFSTVQTTDTTANSLLVGCAVGSTSCTGGIKAGPIVATGAGITGLDEANITDGSLLARVGADEKPTGGYEWGTKGQRFIGTGTPTRTAGSTVGAELQVVSSVAYLRGVTGDGALAPAGVEGSTFAIKAAPIFANEVNVTIAANQNNWNFANMDSAGIWRVNLSGADRTITGIDEGANKGGRIVLVCNVDTGAGFDLTLSEEDALSSAANRFVETDLVTGPVIARGKCGWLYYDSTVSRWRHVSM